jgi:hypothetical protein
MTELADGHAEAGPGAGNRCGQHLAGASLDRNAADFRNSPLSIIEIPQAT